MDEDPVIVSEKVNLLLGFFSYVPESVIRDVLYRPDINGSVEMASEALSTLMEFGEADDTLMNYVQYEQDDTAGACGGQYYKTSGEDWEQASYKSSGEDWEQENYRNSGEDWGQSNYKSNEEDWVQEDYKSSGEDWGQGNHESSEEDWRQNDYKSNFSEDWGQGNYKGSYEDWGEGEQESSKADWEQDNVQTRSGISSDLSSGLRKNEREQAKKFPTQSEKPSLIEQRTSKLDVDERFQSTNSLRSSERERKSEESLPKGERQPSNLVRYEQPKSYPPAKELPTKNYQKISVASKAEDTAISTSKQSDSDDDEDIEKYFESNYGKNEGTHVEKIERKYSGSSIPDRLVEPAREIPKRSISLNAKATAEAVSSKKVNQTRDRQPADLQSQDDRGSGKMLSELTEVKTETSPRKCGQVSAHEVSKTEANDEKKCQETDKKTKRVLPPKPTLPAKISKTKPEQFPRINIPEPKSESNRGVKHVAKETEEPSNKPAPKRRNRGQQQRNASENAPRGKNDQKAGDLSNEGQMNTLGKQTDAKSTTSYESRRLLVSGLSDKTTCDALSNYMELMTGDDVKEVTFLGQGKAVVCLSEPPDFEKVARKVSNRTLDGMQPTVEQIKPCDSILISGLSSKVTKDTVLLYFENVRRSGGGDVKDVVIHGDTHSAVVYFEDAKVIDNVMSKEHTLEERQLSIERHYPQLSSKKTLNPASSGTPAPGKPTETQTAKKQEDGESSPERPTVDTAVDSDIMQFIMSSEHLQELEEKLGEYKAEIEWNLGSKSVKIWKKANSGYVKKWSNSCQTVVCEFLDRFENFSISLEGVLVAAIKDALPRLMDNLPKGKALCKKHDTKNEIVVVCLEKDKAAVSKSVEEILGVIEKEEIRKTYKKETVKGISPEHLLLLDHIGFVDEMKAKHSELEVILDKEKRELYFEGPREQFTDSKIKYFHLMNAFTEQTFPLQSSIFGNIVKGKSGMEYLQARLAREKIMAKFLPQEDNSIKIVAASSTACQKAKECLSESTEQDSVPFQTVDAFIFESAKCKKLFEELQKKRLLEIRLTGNSVYIYGMAEAVVNAKRRVQDFIEVERIRNRSRPISKGLERFLSDHFSEKLKDIEKKLKQYHVSVQIDKRKEVLALQGTQEGLRKCDDCLDELFNSIVLVPKEYSSPGLAKLLLGDKGLRNLKLVEMEKKVVIEIRKKVKDGVRDTRREEVDRFEREEKHFEEEKKKARGEANQNSLNPVYDVCNFTTAEGIKVSWKYGSIENERAGILVNSATSNLTKLTACGKALKAVGGSRFTEACKPHTNVPAGDIVCTASGNLMSQFVLHAVCCHWDNGKGPAEKLLRKLMQKILLKCVEHRVTSVAIPTIGTGQHGFPESVVFHVFKEEIRRFSTSYRSQNTLNEIRVIVFKANSPSTSRTVNQPVPMINPAATNSNISFGSVRVFLHDGDITQQPSSVDAIINVLPSNLQLTKGGGVCKSILQAGGQTIQQQLDGFGGILSGSSVFTTNAGSMTNTNCIIHFVPTSSDVPGLQSAIEECLFTALAQGLSSVSIPAIGTAGFGINPRDSADLILNAAKTFSKASYKLDLNIVVFQNNLVPHFKTAIQQQAQGTTQAQPPATLSTSVLSSLTSRFKGSAKSPPRPSPRASLKTLKTGAAKEVVVLDLFGSSMQVIDSSLDEVDKFIDEHIVTKELKHEKAFDVLIKHWSDVEDLARDHDVSITCSKSPSVANIRGLVANVSDCKEKLFGLITTHVEEERISSQVEFINKNVQWYYFQGSQSVPYDRELNAIIEMAYMENKETFEIQKNGKMFEIDLTAKKETNRKSGQVETITRKQTGDTSSDIAVPDHWSPQSSTQVVQLVSLQPSSSEYQKVLNHFHARGGRATQIIKIERVQNPGLYKAYLVKKQSMNGAENEQQLFHGTRADNIVSINANNFNRSYAGINGVMYGNGVYFARDASYSLKYSKVRSSGYRYMYVASVLVGQFTTGTQGMIAPPPKNDPNNPGLLFDSLVDNPSNPSIFVVFLDHQCYPEYLITFT